MIIVTYFKQLQVSIITNNNNIYKDKIQIILEILCKIGSPFGGFLAGKGRLRK